MIVKATYPIHFIVVRDKSGEYRVPVRINKNGRLTVPGKVLFTDQPTPSALGISNTEYRIPNTEYRHIKNGSVAVGMSEKAVYMSLGRPDKVNRTINSAGTNKQPVYRRMYVYTREGIVTTVQN